VARLLAAVPAIWAIVSERFLLALIVLLLAGISDVLDGLLARSRGQVTRLGAYLDPVADKLLLSGCYLGMGVSGVAPWWLVVLVLGRDILILAAVGVLLLATSVRGFAPSMWGKLSTVVQVIAGVTLLLAAGCPWAPLGRLGWWLSLSAALATAWSGADYLRWLVVRVVRRGNSGFSGHV